MSLMRTNLAQFVGKRVLPFNNPRVVCPPGIVRPNGRRNIIVATPRRSGTHILIDQILNNIPAYRSRPLYIDLSQCLKRDAPGNNLIGQITPNAGYIIKTHLPVGLPGAVLKDARLDAIIAASVVVTVRRDRDDVRRSLARWHKARTEGDVGYDTEYDAFWEFWNDKEQIVLDFKDLFVKSKMEVILDRLANETQTKRATRFAGPTSLSRKRSIYLNKTLTRLLGSNAPHIDTSIHTLKG